MSDSEKKNVLRSTEVLEVHTLLCGELVAVWRAEKFHQLKKGDIFRLWNTDDGERKPDRIIDGEHDVCVALTDAILDDDVEDDPMNYGVQCVHVRGFYTEEQPKGDQDAQ